MLGLVVDEMVCVDVIVCGCEIKLVIGLVGKICFFELGVLIGYVDFFIGVDLVSGYIVVVVKMLVICFFGVMDYVFWCFWIDDIIQFWVGNYQLMFEWYEFDCNKKYFFVILVEDVIVVMEKMLLYEVCIIDLDSLL